MKKTSLADISKALGVSKTLVSMVLNGQGNTHGINVETQKRVIQKAKELNYKPNAMARSLRTGKTNTIGLIVADISNPFYASISRSVENYAAMRGYNVIFASSDEKPKREEELIRMMFDRNVDGLIISSTLTSKNSTLLKKLQEDKYPFTLIDRYVDGLDCDCVLVDNESGAYKATELLIKNGLRKIGLLSIGPSHLSTIKDRISGFKSALKDSNIKIDNSLISEVPFDGMETVVKDVLDNFVKMPNAVQAIFAVNNNLAGAAVNYLNELGIRIPQDVALISFDDVQWFKYSYPAITGVSQPISEIGKNAVEVLSKRIENSDKAIERITLPANIVVRRSCGTFLRK